MLENKNNNVHVIGKVVSDFKFSHEVFGEKFYLTELSIERVSGACDTIPLMVSDRLMDVSQDYSGQLVEVCGQFRSYNRHDGLKSRLFLSIFAREWNFVDGEISASKANEIELEGYICKAPIYRKTPLGREIADLLIAVNRLYGKTDYLPCIVWGRNARFASTFDVGNKVLIMGRIQSRTYRKILSDTEFEIRTAYEVSVFSIKNNFRNGGEDNE